ncbi:RMP1 [Candida pseudojiufengensis]|uniref:RMP1 n=1 Tax=Candida pseudojiufengensis TaxID=497109 RepID=UPI0022255F86|nr:RMP1 [Candida pseudojiufengensis]KAI5962415.1 RMP1 [Candida pseudojiufengensis]
MDSKTFKSLTNEYEILNLLHYRSKNQHHAQNWFKYTNIYVRKLRKILKLQIDINRIKNKIKIEHKKKEIIKLANYLIKISRQAYWNYNSILVLGQFLTLGLALIGNLAKIYCLLLDIPGVNNGKKPITINMDNVNNVSDVSKIFPHDGEDDLGEEVNLEELEKANKENSEVNVGTSVEQNVEQAPTETISSSKENQSSGKVPSEEIETAKVTRKRKANTDSSIDDIFGNKKQKKKKAATNGISKKKKKVKTSIDSIFKS